MIDTPPTSPTRKGTLPTVRTALDIEYQVCCCGVVVSHRTMPQPIRRNVEMWQKCEKHGNMEMYSLLFVVVLLRIYCCLMWCHPENDATARHGNIEIWKHGNMETELGNMEISSISRRVTVVVRTVSQSKGINHTAHIRVHIIHANVLFYRNWVYI